MCVFYKQKKCGSGFEGLKNTDPDPQPLALYTLGNFMSELISPGRKKV